MILERYGWWFSIASQLRMPLRKCMQEHTHREYLAWIAWLQDQWNRPDRHDYYLMQIAMRIAQSRPRKGQKFSIEDHRIPFVEKKPPKKLTKEEATALSKAKWFGFLNVWSKQRGNRN